MCWYEIGGRQVSPLADPRITDAHLLVLQAAPLLGGMMRVEELYFTAFLRRVRLSLLRRVTRPRLHGSCSPDAIQAWPSLCMRGCAIIARPDLSLGAGAAPVGTGARESPVGIPEAARARRRAMRLTRGDGRRADGRVPPDGRGGLGEDRLAGPHCYRVPAGGRQSVKTGTGRSHLVDPRRLVSILKRRVSRAAWRAVRQR